MTDRVHTFFDISIDGKVIGRIIFEVSRKKGKQKKSKASSADAVRSCMQM